MFTGALRNVIAAGWPVPGLSGAGRACQAASAARGGALHENRYRGPEARVLTAYDEELRFLIYSTIYGTHGKGAGLQKTPGGPLHLHMLVFLRGDEGLVVDGGKNTAGKSGAHGKPRMIPLCDV